MTADTTVRPTLLHVAARGVRAPGETLYAGSCDLYDAVLHHLGPSATVLWMRLAQEAMAGRDLVDIDALAMWAGVKPSIVWHALDRLAKWSPADFVSTDTIVIPLYTDPNRWPRRTTRQPATT